MCLCVDFFSTSTHAIRCHTQICKSIAAAKDNDHEEKESKNDDDGHEDDDYLLEEA